MAVYLLELGGDDDHFAAFEARNAARDVQIIATGIATATAIEPDRIRGLAFTRCAGEFVALSPADPELAATALREHPTDRRGTGAVRARIARGSSSISTQSLERQLGAVLVDMGLSVDLTDPDHVLRVVAADDRCFLYWSSVESIRDYGTRRPTDKPFFTPGSMDALEARAIANFAGARPGTTLLDPMCGTAGLLIEAGLLGSMVYGIDAQSSMVEGSARNLETFLDRPTWDLAIADAARLPFRDDTIDAVLFDTPYGRQSRIAAASVDELLSGALTEAYRIAPRTVVVADRSVEDRARAVGWSVDVVFERRVHRSMVRFVHVLDRRDGRSTEP